MKTLQNEPAVLISAIVGLLLAIFGLWIKDAQVLDAIKVVLTWLVPLLGTLIGGWLIRSRVSPVKKDE